MTRRSLLLQFAATASVSEKYVDFAGRTAARVDRGMKRRNDRGRFHPSVSRLVTFLERLERSLERTPLRATTDSKGNLRGFHFIVIYLAIPQCFRD